MLSPAETLAELATLVSNLTPEQRDSVLRTLDGDPRPRRAPAPRKRTPLPDLSGSSMTVTVEEM